MIPNNFFYIFIAITIFIVIINEKVEGYVLNKFFRRYLKEMEDIERKIEENQFYSVLAMASGDKEAYKGFQIILSEMFWPFFFRRMVFLTSLYFILLSPYMLSVHFLLRDVIPNSFSIVLFIAIAFFTARLGYEFIKGSLELRRAAKKAEEDLGKLDDNEMSLLIDQLKSEKK